MVVRTLGNVDQSPVSRESGDPRAGEVHLESWRRGTGQNRPIRAWEQRLLDRYRLISARDLDVELLVLLAWLHHTASSITKAAGYPTHKIWLERNIGHVPNTR